MPFITSKEYRGKTTLSSARISQKINGYHRNYRGNKKQTKYFIPAQWKENIHYKWDKGNLLILDTAI